MLFVFLSFIYLLFYYSLVYLIFYFILFHFLHLTFSVKHSRTVHAGWYAPDCPPVLNRCIRASSSGSRLF